jgi:hypothetical protein
LSVKTRLQPTFLSAANCKLEVLTFGGNTRVTNQHG